MRPAWYALRSGGWREYVTLLHLPYTAWHLSFVVVGGCLAPDVDWGTLGWAVLAFALAVGVGAHALDELSGRPLGTSIPSPLLWGLGVGSVAAACAIGIVGAALVDPWILAFVAAGAFLVPAYCLELGGGIFHTDLWFALAWGGFPVLTAYFAVAGSVGVAAAVAAAWATLLSLSQRALSTPVRRLRREVREVDGSLVLDGGEREPLSRQSLALAPETALRLLSASTVTLAAALALARALDVEI